MGRKKRGRMGPYVPKQIHVSKSNSCIELAKDRNAHLNRPTQLKAFEDFLSLCYIDNIPTKVFYSSFTSVSYKLESCWRLKNVPKKWILSNPGQTVRIFHGTKTGNVASIVLRGLQPSSSGTFGPGIYVAPKINKAIAFTSSDEYQYVLMGTVALGKVYDNVEVRRSIPGDYDSMWVKSGIRNDICLNNDEIVVADPKRVLITHLLVYKLEKIDR